MRYIIDHWSNLYCLYFGLNVQPEIKILKGIYSTVSFISLLLKLQKMEEKASPF